MTLERMIALDPLIGGLLAEAKGQPWHGPGALREQVTNLVGWCRKEGPPELQTELAYTVLYAAAYELSNGRTLSGGRRERRQRRRAVGS